jgi:hypothetical protein
VTTVLERFGRARLLAFDRDALSGMATVEVAHEALLRAWPRLRSWIDEVRDDLRLHDSLAVAAAEWERADRRFPLDAYADPHARALAELLRKAVAEGTFRFDGSDLMPPTGTASSGARWSSTSRTAPRTFRSLRPDDARHHVPGVG